MSDPVNHPDHYTWLKDAIGVEVIDITELFNFNLGNALKYLLRHERKGNAVEDLSKAIFYLDREVRRRTGRSSLDDIRRRAQSPTTLQHKEPI